MTSKTHERQHAGAITSFAPLVLLVVLLVITVRNFGTDILSGASQMVLLLCSALCVLLGKVVMHRPFKMFEEAITRNVSSVATALVILLFIGSLSGTWMVSGVVPTLIYYGLQVMHPAIVLLLTCVICALVSVMTGSSWTTVATIGIALMGIGKALGFQEGWVAGAIISGAYFGDKISPLSDTTVLAASVSGVPLFVHIRNMLRTTVPSMVVTLLIFGVAGCILEHATSAEAAQFANALTNRFVISPWLLIVPLLTALMIARRLSPIVTLFLSTIIGVVAAVLVQTDVMRDIDPSIFRAALTSCFGSTEVPTSDPLLSSLVSTRGMAGMLSTIWLILCAMCFGACMQAGGMVEGMTRVLLRMVRGRFSLVTSHVVTGLLLNIAVADQYLCILLSANIFRRAYTQLGYEPKLLSRTTEDSVTVTSVLVPWNTCGMTQSTVLGVSTLAYLPFCFFNILSPIMSIIISGKLEKLSKPSVKE